MIKPKKQNLHTHSRFSDGSDSPEEIVLAAIENGFGSIGFSEHAYAPYDSDCCIKKADVDAYYLEINRLKREYADKIEIFLGLECDCYTDTPKDGLDYTIGSAHYIFDGEEYFAIDYNHENFEMALNKAACGDIKRLVQIYFDNVTSFAQKYKPDIVGHFDLIKKLNSDSRYFDEKSKWYRHIVEEAIKKIAVTGCIVEVNTGGILRGYCTEPYPSYDILRRFFELNVPVTLASDSHSAGTLDFWFDEAASLIKKAGYRSIKRLTSNGFEDVEL